MVSLPLALIGVMLALLFWRSTLNVFSMIGLVMLMGKGGVGKTTLAAAVAVELARRGLPVHLSTSDPAAHLAETLHGTLEHLTVSRGDVVHQRGKARGDERGLGRSRV